MSLSVSFVDKKKKEKKHRPVYRVAAQLKTKYEILGEKGLINESLKYNFNLNKLNKNDLNTLCTGCRDHPATTFFVCPGPGW